MKKKGNYFVSYLAVDMNDGKFKVYGRGDVVTDAVIDDWNTVIDDLKITISRANGIPFDDIWVVAFNKV
jgi:hypothetical protein